ncbi:MAG: ATP-binding protein [Prosthecobacter sp.]
MVASGECPLLVINILTRTLDGQSLRDTLGGMARDILTSTSIKLTIGGKGDEKNIPDVIGGNLLMIAKEAVTNALMHASAKRLDFMLDYDTEAVTLTIRDDGCGFTPSEAPGPHEGHFGLVGFKERTARIFGQMDIRSSPGCGTTITISSPVIHPTSSARVKAATTG